MNAFNLNINIKLIIKIKCQIIMPKLNYFLKDYY